MKKYAEVLYMIKKADRISDIAARARRNRNLARKAKGLPPLPEPTPATDPSMLTDAQDHISAYNYLNGFGSTPSNLRNKHDAQSIKIYGRPWSEVQRAADIKFAQDRHREQRRELARSRYHNTLAAGRLLNKQQEDIYTAARKRIDRQLEQRIADAKTRNYINPTWQQTMQRYSKAGAPKFSEADRQYAQQILMPSMKGDNPAHARAAAWDAVRRGAAPDIQDVTSDMNPAAIQEIYESGYVPPAGSPGTAQANEIPVIAENQIKPVEVPAQSIQQSAAAAPSPSYDPAQRLQYSQQTGTWNKNTTKQDAQQQASEQNMQDIAPKTTAMQERNAPAQSAPQTPVSQVSQPKTPVTPSAAPQPQNTQNHTRPANLINGKPAEEVIGSVPLKPNQMRINGNIVQRRTNFDLSPEAAAYWNSRKNKPTKINGSTDYAGRSRIARGPIYRRRGIGRTI